MDELFNTEFPEPEYIVQGLLPAGLSSLGGRTKIGKPLLALQLAYAVALPGSRFLGIKTSQRSVCYLALEDSPRRLKSRNNLQGNFGIVPLTFEMKWDTFKAGGKESLLYIMRENLYGLIIVDTVGRLFSNLDQIDNSQMSCLYGDLQTTALENDVSLLFVDHMRKQNGFDQDPIEGSPRVVPENQHHWIPFLVCIAQKMIRKESWLPKAVILKKEKLNFPSIRTF